MNHFYDWGITLSADHPENLNFSATGKLFHAMCEYFEPPECEEYQVPRTELEEYIRAERASCSRKLDEDDCEWIDLINFLGSSKQEHFCLCAWW